MANLAEWKDKDVKIITDLSQILQAEKVAFECLMGMALEQTTDCSTKENPELFLRVEQILQPIYFSWKEKYAFINDVLNRYMIKRQSFDPITAYDTSGTGIFYNQYKTGGTNHYNSHLKIRAEGVSVECAPWLLVQAEWGWEEKFGFESHYWDKPHYKQMKLTIQEIERTMSAYVPTDKIIVVGEECLVPPRNIDDDSCSTVYPRIKRSFALLVRRQSLQEKPIKRRLE